MSYAGGLLWYNGVSDSASLNPALNTAMLMTRYASLASTDSKAQSYLVSFCNIHLVTGAASYVLSDVCQIAVGLRLRKQSHAIGLCCWGQP
jgi:hypothetical protein